MGFPINADQVLRLFDRLLVELEADPENVENAFLCVAVIAHLPERVAAETGITGKKQVNALRASLEEREPFLRYVRELNNFAKHVKLTLSKPKIDGLRASDYVHSQRFFFSMINDEDFLPDLDVRGYQVEISIDTHVPLLGMLKKVSAFWNDELVRLHDHSI